MKPIILLLINAFILHNAGAAPQTCPLVEQLVLQINVATTNIANSDSTMTTEGGPYKRKNIYCEDSGRCQITEVAEFRSVYQPEHPHADPSGFVLYPKINVMTEMSLLVGLRQAYDQAVRVCHSK